jgi:hypothetical protein
MSKDLSGPTHVGHPYSHHATGNCVFGQLVNLSGHDTGVTGRYVFTGITRATVRSDNATLLRVQFSGLPSGSSIEVRDPERQPLNANRIDQPIATVAGDGTLDYKIKGAGVYLVSLTSTVTQVVNGAGKGQMFDFGNYVCHGPVNIPTQATTQALMGSNTRVQAVGAKSGAVSRDSAAVRQLMSELHRLRLLPSCGSFGLHKMGFVLGCRGVQEPTCLGSSRHRPF